MPIHHERIIWEINLRFVLLTVIFLLLMPMRLSATNNPWLLQKFEKRIEGVIVKIEQNQIFINNDQKDYCYVLENNVLSALMGKCSGQLLKPVDFPVGIEVELFINIDNKVRAMRNTQINITSSIGIPLDGWGHYASLSPDEEYYCLYNYETGLQLFRNAASLDSPIPINSSSPVYLSPLSVFAWNNKGELITVSQDEFVIFDPENRTSRSFNLPKTKNESTCRIITSINWNNSSDKLLFSSLEDYPDTEGSFFNLFVANQSGQIIGLKPVENLGDSVWLSNDLILYLEHTSIENNLGRMMLWNYTSGKTVEFLPMEDTYYSSFAYSPKYDLLAFTKAYGQGEIICLLNMNTGIIQEITVLPYPIHNLQWSDKGTLLFWDKYNNCIFQISNLPLHELLSNTNSITTPLCNGYLPARSVRSSFIYFLAEPMEEPQQPYMQQ